MASSAERMWKVMAKEHDNLLAKAEGYVRQANLLVPALEVLKPGERLKVDIEAISRRKR